MRLSTTKIITLAFGVFAMTFGACAATDSKDNQPLQNGCSTTPDCGSCSTCYDGCVCAGNDAQTCLDACAANGGAGGTNSNGGTGNTANGGSGNAANGGSGNTGNGGSGNTGNGGSGNTGNGGSGNASSCDAAVQFNDVACGECASGACCTELQNCFGTSASTEAPPCALLLDCIQSFCANAADDTEFQNCVQQECASYITQESVDAYNGLSCVDDNCAAACGG